MKKTLKRTLALALTLVMLTAMVPMLASAADTFLVADVVTNNTDIAGTTAPLRNSPRSANPGPVVPAVEDKFTVKSAGWTTSTGAALTGANFGDDTSETTNTFYSIVLEVEDGDDDFGVALDTPATGINLLITALTDGAWAIPVASPTSRMDVTDSGKTLTIRIAYAIVPPAGATGTGEITSLNFGSAKGITAPMQGQPRTLTPVLEGNAQYRVGRQQWGVIGSATGGNFGLADGANTDIYEIELIANTTTVDWQFDWMTTGSNFDDYVRSALVTALSSKAANDGIRTPVLADVAIRPGNVAPIAPRSVIITIPYVIQPFVVTTSIVTIKDIDKAPVLDGAVSDVKLPEITGTGFTANASWTSGTKDGKFLEDANEAVVTVTLTAAAGNTFANSKFFTSPVVKDNWDSQKWIDEGLSSALGVVATVSGNNLVVVIRYALMSEEPENAKDLRDMLEDNIARIIPINSNIGITTGDAIILGNTKTLLLKDGVTVNLGRFVNASFGNALTVDGKGTLALTHIADMIQGPASGVINLKNGATLSTQGRLYIAVNAETGSSVNLTNDAIIYSSININPEASLNAERNITLRGSINLIADDEDDEDERLPSGKATVKGDIIVHGALYVEEDASLSIAGTITLYGGNFYTALYNEGSVTAGGLSSFTYFNNLDTGTIIIKGTLSKSEGEGFNNDGLILAEVATGSEIETLAFISGGRTVYMVERIGTRFFDIAKMGDGTAYFTSAVTGWFRAGSPVNEITNAIFPRVNGPLYGTQTAPPQVSTPGDLVARIYEHMLNRPGDTAGQKFWTDMLVDKKITGRDLAFFFVDSPEFKANSANMTNAEFVDSLYMGLLGRLPDAGGRTFWVGVLAGGATRQEVAVQFAGSAEIVLIFQRLGIVP